MYYERKALPKCNKITYKRGVKHSYDLHRQRLATIKPSIDNKAPRRFKHLKRNLKKEQMMEDRFAQIEHENRLLLSKMSEIMSKSTLDNHNTSLQYGHSLNREARKRELQKITMENQAILHRIQTREPVYNHYEWEEDRVKAEKYLRNIMEYKPRADGDGVGPPTTGMYEGILDEEDGGRGLAPLDDDYRRSSRERLDAAMEEGDHFPEPEDARLAPLGGGGGGGGAGRPATDDEYY